MIGLLKKLINAASTAQTGELAAAKVLTEYLSRPEIDTRLDQWQTNRANHFSRIKSAGQRPALLFACHLDVVPQGDQAWQHDPFQASQCQGKIFGRGAVDMKGPIAAIAKAIVDVVDSGIELKGDIVLAATAAEETDSSGMHKFLKDYRHSLPSLAGVIVTEPTNFELVTAHRGMVWLEIATTGKTAHSSMPDLGINAIDSMRMFLNHLKKLDISSESHSLLGKNTLSVNQIFGGDTINVIPDYCSAKIDIRTLPSQDCSSFIGRFEKIFAEIKTTSPDFAGEAKPLREIPAFCMDPEADFVKLIKNIAGLKEVKAAPFTTDAPFLAQLNSPVVIIGPGKPELCHKPDEYIEIKDLEKAVQLYKNIIMDFLT